MYGNRELKTKKM